MLSLAKALAVAVLGWNVVGMQAQEGPMPTQALVLLDSKAGTVPTIQNIKLELDGKPAQLTDFQLVQSNGVQIALLIDDGLRRTIGSQFNDIKAFFDTLPSGTEILVGYMGNGTVTVAQPFTTERGAAAASLRMPFGIAGISASPYFCLSEFVMRWPGARSEAAPAKARFVIMLTNGVDPYNGSTRMSNQDSPYVQEAVDDANRAGVAVYSIYFGDTGIRGGSASFSGQSYLNQVAVSTGAQTYYQGTGSPVSLLPYFKQFQHAIAETYVASFVANAGRSNHDLVRLKISADIPKLKLRVADAVRPGNIE